MKTALDNPPEQNKSSGILRNRAFDGFRGFALIILMLAHFGAGDIFPGAWLGINFFLVFSGYIIVTLLLVERVKTGKVDIVRFYRRRAKRLLPALFLLMTVVGTWALFFAENYVKRGMKGDILATLGYVMNWRLILDSDDYFAHTGVPTFFRHAWTLAVEEQFYIFAPMIVLATLALTKSRWVRIGIMLGLAALSAAWAAHIGATTPTELSHSYYGTDTRAQAIFIGIAFAFLLGPDDNGRELNIRNTPVMNFLGWAAVIVNVWFYTWIEPTDAWVFEKWGIFWISLSTLPGFIVVRENKPNLLRRIFSNPVFVIMGLMTYGLYLWHWPVQLWMKIYAPDLSNWQMLVVGSVVTTVIAFISFRFMEVTIILKGLNHFAGSRKRARALIWTSLTVIITIAFLLGSGSSSVPKLQQNTPDYEAGTSTRTIATFGDSTARYFFGDMPTDVYTDLKIEDLSYDGCDIIRLPAKWDYDEYREPETGCLEARQSLTESIGRTGADTFVLMPGAAVPLVHRTDTGADVGPTDEHFSAILNAELDDIFGRVREAGIEDLRVMTIPCRENDLSKIEVQVTTTGKYFEDNPDLSMQVTEPVLVNGLISQWAEKNQVGVLDIYGALGCEGAYQRKINGVTVYRDWFHFSEDSAAMIWSWLAPELQGTRGTGRSGSSD